MASYWEGHAISMALCYANGVLAPGVDVDCDGGVKRSVGLLRRWIDEHTDAPVRLCRIAVEYLDSSERDEHVQRRWNSGQ